MWIFGIMINDEGEWKCLERKRFKFSVNLKKVKAILLQTWTSPEGSRFQDNRHMKLVTLSALHTGRLYPPRKYSWYSFMLEAESTPRAILQPEGLCQ